MSEVLLLIPSTEEEKNKGHLFHVAFPALPWLEVILSREEKGHTDSGHVPVSVEQKDILPPLPPDKSTVNHSLYIRSWVRSGVTWPNCASGLLTGLGMESTLWFRSVGSVP